MHAPSDAPNLTVFLASPWTCRPMCMHLINALCLPFPFPCNYLILLFACTCINLPLPKYTLNDTIQTLNVGHIIPMVFH